MPRAMPSYLPPHTHSENLPTIAPMASIHLQDEFKEEDKEENLERVGILGRNLPFHLRTCV